MESEDIKQLAQRKVQLQSRLMLIAAWNTAGKTEEELADVELRQIETLRELNMIEREISKYVAGGSCGV